MKWLLASLVTVTGLHLPTTAQEKPAQSPIKLTLIAKTDKYKFDGGGKTPAEYKKYLEQLAEQSKQGQLVQPPRPPAVDLVLELKNTSDREVTIYVGGDPNVYTFELTGGAGSVAMNSGLAFTADFRLPKAVTLGPGKTHTIPIQQLSDGNRGASRYVYWTGPGEYQLSVKYTLSDSEGGRGTELKSEPVKIIVTEK
ncbi:MAG: hypothetical protein RMJ56_17265 [Gemmataceae bacterium]|nr:hypothetical protein [Gemmata sp.]MDW8199346.1 hypothetical protein [Gemmataceae bacterium]